MLFIMKKSLTITLKENQYKQLREVAELDDRSISSMVRVILDGYLGDVLNKKTEGNPRSMAKDCK